VRDPAGAAVPGATVRIKSTTTNVETTAMTNGEGNYQVPSLPAGNYTLRAAAQGFKTAVRTDVTLEVSQQATFDATTSSVGDVVDSTANDVAQFWC